MNANFPFGITPNPHSCCTAWAAPANLIKLSLENLRYHRDKCRSEPKMFMQLLMYANTNQQITNIQNERSTFFIYPSHKYRNNTNSFSKIPHTFS